MQRVKSMAGSLASQDNGATMVEYALMLALVALACFATIGAMGVQLDAFFRDFVSRMP